MAMRRWGVLLPVAALLFGFAPAAASAQEMIGGRSIVEAVEQLKPGEFLWEPEIAPEGPVLLIVSTATQRAVLYRNGVPIAVTTVSTGRPGYRTPTGVFTILQKHVQHFSSIYDNAPMPYMQRLTWRGVALHGGQLPGYPASHGCIRLPLEFAKLLFGATHLGMTVIVTDAAAAPRLAPTRDPLPEAGAVAGERSQWQPDRAPTGPVSIVISAADRRLVVLRDGREIGTAPVSIGTTTGGTRAFMLRAADDGTPHWYSLALPGQEARETSAPDWSDFLVDPTFRAQLATVIVPGTTVVMTADSLVPGARPVAVLEVDPEKR